MNMATNGEGRARFNPNLYADGKVSHSEHGRQAKLLFCIVYDCACVLLFWLLACSLLLAAL